ncbi:helix-turn-helix domain-containing protein [Halalkalibacter krulwichiae]|uniref:Purine catabolism regulatory protein n=1 Tax=Halalkalibacter krulwichiae TaxID=199441 RepID=A0A1X9MEC4_9BACI|nr:helix-turn-helix domain-containing protein [Halalkalibacter krulwichiae]ARK30493.1 Purine catabolism regulatory protein [Halalkalibacter krulwichiae]
MYDIDYSLLFLKKKLKDTPFQVWGLNYHNNKSNLLYNHGNENSLVPPLLTFDNEQLYVIKKQTDKIFIYYFFEGGNQVNVCIFNHALQLSKEEIEYLYYFFSVSQTKGMIQKKETELNNVVDSIRSITSSLDLDEVLEKIVSNALKVIPAADAGFLLLYDQQTKKLLPKAPVGFEQSIYNFKVKVGESITGKVFEDGIGRIFNTKEELYEKMELYNISSENYLHITSAGKIPEAAMCVPIFIEENRIGVMIIHQWYKKKVWVNYDLNLLHGFALQAAIAIQNAQFYNEANKRLLESLELSKQLEERNSQLQKRQEIHESLINISLKNKGFETIISEIDQMIDPPLYFFNMLDNKFYSSDFTQCPISLFEIKVLFSERRRRPLYVEINNISSQSYYLYPIYNGVAFLGCFIIRTTKSFSIYDRITLEQSSSVLTLELVKTQTITEIFYKKIHEQFQGLLNTQDADQLMKQAQELGLNPSAHYVITILEIPNYSELQLLEIEIHQLVLKLKAELVSMEKVIYGFHNKVILLFSTHDLDQFKYIQQKLLIIKKEWENNNGSPFRGGISFAYKGLEKLCTCYDEATKTISFLSTRNKSEVICYKEIGLNRLFLNQSTQEIVQFINEVFLPLRSDNEKNKELEKTLVKYMENNRSAVKTAEQLHIHINTLYQRIKKIEELIQLNLDNNEDTLKLQLACYLRSTYYQT